MNTDRPKRWCDHGADTAHWVGDTLLALALAVVVPAPFNALVSALFGFLLWRAVVSGIQWRRCYRRRVTMWELMSDPLTVVAKNAFIEGDRATFEQAVETLAKEGKHVIFERREW